MMEVFVLINRYIDSDWEMLDDPCVFASLDAAKKYVEEGSLPEFYVSDKLLYLTEWVEHASKNGEHWQLQAEGIYETAPDELRNYKSYNHIQWSIIKTIVRE